MRAAPEQLSIPLNKLSYLQLQDFLVTFDSSNSSSFFAFFGSYKVFTDLTFKINSRFNVFQCFFCYCCCCFSVDCKKVRFLSKNILKNPDFGKKKSPKIQILAVCVQILDFGLFEDMKVSKLDWYNGTY